MKKVVVILAALFLTSASFAAYTVCDPEDNVWFVDWNGTGDYTTIQASINAASTGDCIWVKEGTYSENIDITTDGLSIYGGFPSGSWDWGDRDPSSNETNIQGVYEVGVEDTVYLAASSVIFDGFVVKLYSGQVTGIMANLDDGDDTDIIISSNALTKDFAGC